jgi:biopolymer transport protein ExbB
VRQFPIMSVAAALSLFTAGPALAGTVVPVLPAKMTAWSMFMGADWVVKGVMLVLVAASIATWGVAIGKQRELRRMLNAMKTDLGQLDTLHSLAQAPPLRSPASALLVGAARQELTGCIDMGNPRSADAMTERLSIRLAAAEAEIVQSVRGGFSVLASIGAIAPFVGLFGTVWGVMNSFIGISQAQTTNLAVVAPGIAEALLATALGLVAAIPAVLFYNMFSRQMAGVRRQLHTMTARVACLVSREVEQAQVSHLKVAV